MTAGQARAIVDTRVAARVDHPVGALVTRKGRTLAALDTVSRAQRVFRNPSVHVLPIVDGRRYVGAVARGTIAAAAPDETLGALAVPLLPTVPADLPLDAALERYAGDRATRFVVLDPDDAAYRGLVCLTPERDRLCIAAECHAEPLEPPPSTPGGPPS